VILIENIFTYTINESLELNKIVIVKPSKVFQIEQQLYLHKFSDKFDVLIGREYINGCNAKTNFSAEQ